jgi:hypothetical protein
MQGGSLPRFMMSGSSGTGTNKPPIVVPLGARVTIELVNADADTAHRLGSLPVRG